MKTLTFVLVFLVAGCAQAAQDEFLELGAWQVSYTAADKRAFAMAASHTAPLDGLRFVSFTCVNGGDASAMLNAGLVDKLRQLSVQEVLARDDLPANGKQAALAWLAKRCAGV
jgi:uncharacterized protein YbjT (DUF2867 family)